MCKVEENEILQKELPLNYTELEYIAEQVKLELGGRVATNIDLPRIIYTALLDARESEDLDVGVGSVIFDSKSGEILVVDRNRLPYKVFPNPERLSKTKKLFYTGHAEANAISTAAREGIPLLNTSLLVTSRFPCGGCASSIANSGISTVYAPGLDVGNRWYESNKAALEIFEEEGVNVIILDLLNSTFLKLDKEPPREET